MIVIDASVWISYVIPQDVNHAATVAWLRPYLLQGGRLAAPLTILSEVGGAVARVTDDDTWGFRAVQRLLRLADLQTSPDLHPVPASIRRRRASPLRLIAINERLALAAAQIAITNRIKGADAVYVAVAERLRIPLVSWDGEHRTRAASRIQVYTPDKAP